VDSSALERIVYFAFGSHGFVIILDLPSSIDMAATSIVAQASGTVKSRVTVLMTPEDVDKLSRGKLISARRSRVLELCCWSQVTAL